jgi:hypothetical protein
MYSKEQVATRLRLGTNLNIPELVLIVKSLMEKVDELESKYNELSENRRGSNKVSGEDVQPSTIRSIFKL